MTRFSRQIVAAVFGATAAPVAWAQSGDGIFGSPSRFTELGGTEIYRSVCAGCHMADGRGASGAATFPSLAHNPRLADSSTAIQIILRGQRAMPPFARTLSDQQVANVVTYIRQNFGNSYGDGPSAADVAAAR